MQTPKNQDNRPENTYPEIVKQLFTQAHTAYKFDPSLISDQTLEDIYEATKMAPTTMNSQPLRIIYLKSNEAKARILPLIPGSNRTKSETAPVIAILAFDINFHEHFAKLSPNSPGIKDKFADESKRIIFAGNNAHLQAGYFILAVRAFGLDAGPMAGIDIEGINKEFFTGTSYQALFVVNIGKVAEEGNYPRSPRLAVSEAVKIL